MGAATPATGSFLGRIVVDNIGATPCAISGIPSLSGVRGGEAEPVTLQAHVNPDLRGSPPRYRDIDLAPGGDAIWFLQVPQRVGR